MFFGLQAKIPILSTDSVSMRLRWSVIPSPLTHTHTTWLLHLRHACPSVISARLIRTIVHRAIAPWLCCRRVHKHISLTHVRLCLNISNFSYFNLLPFWTHHPQYVPSSHCSVCARIHSTMLNICHFTEASWCGVSAPPRLCSSC